MEESICREPRPFQIWPLRICVFNHTCPHTKFPHLVGVASAPRLSADSHRMLIGEPKEPWRTLDLVTKSLLLKCITQGPLQLHPTAPRQITLCSSTIMKKICFIWASAPVYNACVLAMARIAPGESTDGCGSVADV